MSAARVNYRQAGPADVDAVTDLMILSMQGDRGWWDYRFPHRHQHPGDHRKFLRLLVETWVSPDSDNWVVVLAEVYDQSSGTNQVACYAAWDISLSEAGEVLARAGAASRRDTDPAHAAEDSRACDEGHEKFLDTRFGTEQVHLQALGTHPLFLRISLARALCRWGMDLAAREGVAATLLASPIGGEGENEKTKLYAMAWVPEKNE